MVIVFRVMCTFTSGKFNTYLCKFSGYVWKCVIGVWVCCLPYVVIVMAHTHDKAYYRSHPRVDFSKAQAYEPASITYKLFTKDTPDTYTVLTEKNVETEILNKDVKTLLFIHGWTSNDSSPWYAPLKEAYFQKQACNIIYVDWSEYGNMSYRVSAANVKPVGQFVAAFLGKSGVPAERLHLIGHSLGSQLSGFIGKAYQEQNGKKIGRITGLDPAGPQWSNQNMSKEERLSDLDADFVDVVHTDIQMYGYTHPCGHVDFYPNGGTNQPGCADVQSGERVENCNHHRATRLFIESINTRVEASEIDIKEDDDYNIVIAHKDNSNTVIFGEHTQPTTRGVFYFKTCRGTTPFLKNSE